MWKDLLTSDAFALIASSGITAVGTLIVAKWSYKRSERPNVRTQASGDVYKAWIKTLRGQLYTMQKDFDGKTSKMQERINELEDELNTVTGLSKRRLDKLLVLSRRYDVDISDVI